MPNLSEWNLRYQDHIQSEDFPVTIFSHKLNRDGPNYLHFHRGIELGYCYSGQGNFYIDRRIHSFSSGIISIIFPGQMHIAHSVGEEISQWDFAGIDIDKLFDDIPACALLWKRLLNESDTIPNFYDDKKYPDIYSLLQMICSELRRPEYQKDCIRALVWALLVKLNVLCGTHQPGDGLSEDLYHLIWPAVEYMTGHYGETICCEDLTKLCFCSEATFRRAFFAVMERTPIQYLTEIRLKAAVGLLRTTSMSICDISLEVGYQNVSAFNRAFKKRYGVTPMSYRAQ